MAWHQTDTMQTIVIMPAEQPWRICVNVSCEFTITDNITTTKQNTITMCTYFMGYTLLEFIGYMDGLVQERHNSIANALELCLPCTNPWICPIISTSSVSSPSGAGVLASGPELLPLRDSGWLRSYHIAQALQRRFPRGTRTICKMRTFAEWLLFCGQ